MRKIFLFAALVLGTSSLVSAQQDPQFTMYMFNRQILNPAYAGTIHATNLTLLGRAQWVGIPGAPNTTTASISGWVPKIHGGLGAYIVGDKLGPLGTVGIKAAYSFHMKFGQNQEEDAPELNIGVGGGIYQKTLNGIWKYDQDHGQDLSLPLTGQSTIVPDLDAGLYFHKPLPIAERTSNVEPRDKFYIGGSVSHLLEPSLKGLITQSGSQAVLPRCIQGSAGYTIKLDPGIYLQPSVNFRMAGPLTQLDVNVNLYVSPMVFGISHRGMKNSDSFSGIIGFNATTQLFMAYSYDYTVSNLLAFNTGSHEIIVSYTFPSKTRIVPGEGDTRTQHKP